MKTKSLIKHLILQIKNAILGFLAVVLIIFAIQYSFWIIYPYSTAEIEVPIPVLNENRTVLEGESLQLQLKVQKNSDFNPTVTRNYVCEDGTTYFLPLPVVGGVTRPRGQTTTVATLEIPKGLPRNQYCYFEFISQYQVNPIRIIVKNWRSESFLLK